MGSYNQKSWKKSVIFNKIKPLGHENYLKLNEHPILA